VSLDTVVSELRELLKVEREQHMATASRMAAAEDRVQELEAASSAAAEFHANQRESDQCTVAELSHAQATLQQVRAQLEQVQAEKQRIDRENTGLVALLEEKATEVRAKDVELRAKEGLLASREASIKYMREQVEEQSNRNLTEARLLESRAERKFAAWQQQGGLEFARERINLAVPRQATWCAVGS